MSTATCTDLILDIGGVVMTYSLKKAGTISHHTLGAILDSLSWHDYERAKVSKRECYDSISTDFKLPEGALETALSEAAASLKPNYYFIEEIKRLKQECPKIRVHAFSNISQPDFDEIEAEIMSWGLFDNVLTSAAIKCRKPELQSYSLVLDRIKSDASSCVFVDDKLENVMAAHSLGMKGILFKTSEETVTSIYNLIGDPVQRGSNFLQERSRNLFSETEGGMTLKDNFSQLLILYSTGNSELVSLDNKGRTWQYFIGAPVFTTCSFPDDLDTTSLAMSTLDVDEELKQEVMDKMMLHLTNEGLPMTYFDNVRRRYCPFVAANVLRLFYLNGQGHRLQTTLKQLCRILKTRAYEIGSRYYCQPEWLLYYLADLCGRCDNPELDELAGLVKAEVGQRIGRDKDIMAASLRAVSAQALGLDNSEDVQTLLATQELDGGWGLAWMVKYGSSSLKIGNRGVVTAMAVNAIRTSCAV